MNEIPVYLFTGFMDSGKTSLIKDTLFEQGFAKEGKSLVICCEDGDAEFTDEELEKNNVKLVMVDSEADFTEDFLKKVNTEYQPEQVFLEYNGTFIIVYHRAVQALAYSFYSCQHSLVPLSFLEIGDHLLHLYTFAYGIRQNAFQSVSGIKLDTALIGNQ